MQENKGRERETERVGGCDPAESFTHAQTEAAQISGLWPEGKKGVFSPNAKHVESLDNSRQIRSFVHTVCVLKTGIHVWISVCNFFL